MIKFLPKINNFTAHFLPKFKKSKQIPTVEKPLIVYMPIFKDPDNRSDFGFGGLFDSLNSLLSEFQSETKKEVEAEKKVEKKVEYKQEVKKETKVEKKEKPKVETPVISYTSFTTSPYKEPEKESVVKKIFEGCKNAISEKYNDIKSDIWYAKHKRIWKRENKKEELQNLIRNNLFITANLDMELVSKLLSAKKPSIKKIDKIIAQVQELQKIQRQKEIQEALQKQELLELQKEFKNRFEMYQDMFAPDDMRPDLSVFENYNNLSYVSLKALLNNLNRYIKHQELIEKLKKVYRRGADYYVNNSALGQNNKANLLSTKLKRIAVKSDPSNFNYRAELKRLCKIYLANSKIIEKPLESFNNVMERFFSSAKINVKEIFDSKQGLAYYSERIPILGAVPKTLRIVGDINLTRCILKDYKDITNQYVKDGIQPTMELYSRQYDYIREFANAHVSSEQDRLYTEKLLKIIQEAKDKRLKAYAKIFYNYEKGGGALRNICYNVRLKDGISLGFKLGKLIAAGI